METKQLTLSHEYPRLLEHPLFRAGMQMVVGIEQNHSKEACSIYAANLKAALQEINHTGETSWNK